MIKYKEIISKTLRASYEKVDIEDYKVVGSVAYNINNRIIDANGDIRDADTNAHIANFNVYSEGETVRMNLTDCITGKMMDAVTVAEATLADLSQSYPQETDMV